MPNSFTQIHIQAIFAVKYRDALIQKEGLHKYITGIVMPVDGGNSIGF
jgi:hypothetical protein